ncbi:MAG: HEAT repeat domain-containing protein, partial [Gemmataceae bacterium]
MAAPALCSRSILIGWTFLAVWGLGGTSSLDSLQARQSSRPALPEAKIEGRTIAEWSKELTQPEATGKLRALQALGKAGPEAAPAIPALLALFSGKEPSLWQPLTAAVLVRVGPSAVAPLQKALKSDRPEVRRAAAMTLGLMGTDAGVAIESLREALADDDPEVRRLAIRALGQVGPPARRAALASLETFLRDSKMDLRLEASRAIATISSRPPDLAILREALKSSDPAVLEQALVQAGDQEGKASSVLDQVRSLTRHPQADIRLLAAEAQARIQKNADEVLPLLEESIRGGELDTRRSAIAVLGAAPGGPKTTARLLELLSDKNPVIRREAVAALVGKPLEDDASRQILRTRLRDADRGVRWWSALSLASSPSASSRKEEEDVVRAFHDPLLSLSPDAEAWLEVRQPARMVPHLMLLMKGGPGRLTLDAARLLARLGSGDTDAWWTLEDLLRTEDAETRWAAGDALAAMGPGKISRVVRLLRHENPSVRSSAARLLGEWEVASRSALPALESLLKDGDPGVRSQAALALYRISGAADPALPALLLNLKDLDAPERWQAIDAVGWIARTAQPPIRGLTEILVNGLKDREVRVRVQAARALWRRTRQARTIVPLLRDALSDRDAVARRWVVETLGEMSAEDRVVPLLAMALEDREMSVRLAAEEAMIRLGSAAVPSLLEALASRNPRVRLGVLQALSRLDLSPDAAKTRLTPLRDDADPAVRALAEEILARRGGS